MMQDSRLNYVEQHAERIGLDSEKLESLRVSASKASPMGDTLDLCARYADSKTLEEMVRPQYCTPWRETGMHVAVPAALMLSLQQALLRACLPASEA